jgi:hypothetical protein
MIISKEIALVMLATLGIVSIISTAIYNTIPVDREFEVRLEFARVFHDDVGVVARGQIINNGDVEINDIQIVWVGIAQTHEQLYNLNLNDIATSDSRDISIMYNGAENIKSVDFVAYFADGSSVVQSVPIP